MSKEYQFEHKCRRCGEINLSGIGNEATALDTLQPVLAGKQVANILAPRMLEMHYCPDGGIGVADLIGCRALSSE